MGHTNPTYDAASIQDEPQYMDIADVGFHNPHFEPGNHYQSLNNAQRRPDYVYMELDFNQSEV